MGCLERLSTGQVSSVERPTLSVHAAGGNLARDRQNEADVIYGASAEKEKTYGE
jgi:hypothetical protein